MGTNYYRIPTQQEMEERKAKLINDVNDLDMNPLNMESVWDRFTEGTSIHLGKRSGGWKFCWNFHDNKYYKDRDSLLDFIRSGRVIDEYGEVWNVEEFINMAFEWGQPDGLIADEKYMRENNPWMSNPQDYADKIIDGLRVSSSTEFS